MKLGWDYRKIGDIMSVERGGSPRPIKKYLTQSPDGLNWIKIGDASNSNKYIERTQEKIIKEGLKKSRFVEEGDFLLSNSMSFGRPYIMKTNGCIHDGWLVLKNKKNVELDKDFLYYMLCSPNIFEQFDKLAAGSTVRNLNIALVSSVKIPIPPLTEQKQIVAILDAAFTAIHQAKVNIEKNIENAKEIFQSGLNDVFSNKNEIWAKRKLIEVNKFIDYRGKTPKKTTVGIRLITAKNVKMGYLQNNPEEFISPDDYDAWMTRGIPIKGDVLFTTEAPLANVTLINTDDKVALAQRIITLCPNREILSGEYLTYCLQSREVQDKIISKGTGATVTGIKSRWLKEIVIPIAPKDQQVCIVENLDELKKYSFTLKRTYEKKVIVLENLKKSLLQKAFAGELT